MAAESARSKALALLRALIAEFLGVTIFVYVGCMQATSGGGVLAAAFAHGLTIAVLIAGMAHISGGHFNPAVSLGVFIAGRLPLLNTLLYMLVQLIGGFVGALLARATMDQTTYMTVNGGATMPNYQLYSVEQLVLCESILTYLLVHTVLMAAVDTESNVLAPLVIGCSVSIGVFAGSAVSGASMNPARSLGPALTYQLWGGPAPVWTLHYIYYVGPAIGACFAAVVYRTFLAKDGARWLL